MDTKLERLFDDAGFPIDSAYRVLLGGRVIGTVTKDQAVLEWYARLPRRASARICRTRRAAIAYLVKLAK